MITLNMDKAKKIGNEIRRTKAQEYFAPYDKIIELNIPGQEEKRAEAEVQRTNIRNADAACQIKIDSATTGQEITQALNEFVV
jgi:hypothetical protein